MGLHPQLGAFKPADSRRLFFLKELGCVACFLRFGAAAPGGEGHHAEDDAGTVIGHRALIVLCPWHHQGKPTQGETVASHGPSRHRHTVAFTAAFGTDLQLLAQGTERLDAYLATFVIPPL
jgi:hypothetical protein